MIYINNGLAYIPICNQITEIIIKNENFIKESDSDKICYKDFLIDYKSNGTTRKGFLRYENIITTSSTKINCNLNNEKELIIDNKIKLSKKNNKISISKYSSSQIKLKNRGNQLNNIFNHHKYLTNGTDVFENIDAILTIQNENVGSSNNNGILNTNKLEKEEDFNGYFYTVFTESGFFFRKLFMFLFFTLITIFFLFVIMYLVSRLCPSFKIFLVSQYAKIKLEYTKFKVHFKRIKEEHLRFRNV